MKFSEWLELREMMGSVAAIPSCSYCSSPDFQVQGAYCSKCRKKKRKTEWMEQKAARLSDYLKSKYGKKPVAPTSPTPIQRGGTKVEPQRIIQTSPIAQQGS